MARSSKKRARTDDSPSGRHFSVARKETTVALYTAVEELKAMVAKGDDLKDLKVGEYVAKRQSAHVSTVFRHMKEYRSTGSVSPSKKGGNRPQSLDIDIHLPFIRQLVSTRAAAGAPFSVPQLQEAFESEFNIKPSQRTLRRRLRDWGFKFGGHKGRIIHPNKNRPGVRNYRIAYSRWMLDRRTAVDEEAKQPGSPSSRWSSLTNPTPTPATRSKTLGWAPGMSTPPPTTGDRWLS